MPRILIANEGLSASKCCLSLKHREDVHLICFDNRASNFAYLGYVDEVIPRPKDAGDDLFLNPEALIQAAKECNAEWIYPGWGYLSECASFAARVEDAGLRFMGPSADTLHRLGNKIECARLSEELGVPGLPWSKGPVDTLEDVKGWVAEIGLPVMLKAALGGGGRGIRPVRTLGSLEEVYVNVR